ncbi:MAG: type I-E CRISPR-associated endonuclease Cas1e [Anaerolineae bacterium]
MRDLHELPKLRDGLSYLYAEHCSVEQEGLSVSLWDKEGRTLVPAAALAVLMLGPGVSISTAAVKALCDNGCSLVWCGEEGVRCYASATGETRRARRVLRQAEAVVKPDLHREAVWRMYERRFGYSLDSDLSLPQIRGMEGARMRQVYANASAEYGVGWHGRRYDRQEWERGDPVNRALSAANACLNGVCHAAIVSVGYSPALGFVHVGKQLSFVYDVADLYKAEITIPLAFRLVREGKEGLETRIRHACRDAFRDGRLLGRIVTDMDDVVGYRSVAQEDDSCIDSDPALPESLWQELLEVVSHGPDRSGA